FLMNSPKHFSESNYIAGQFGPESNLRLYIFQVTIKSKLLLLNYLLNQSFLLVDLLHLICHMATPYT
ncbi:unnamed protein product, partial [Allacma fusca]